MFSLQFSQLVQGICLETIDFARHGMRARDNPFC